VTVAWRQRVSIADGKRSWRRAVWTLIVGTAVGAALIAMARRVAPGVSAAQARLVLAAMGVLAVAPLLALAAYLWRLGARARRTGQFPPPGTAAIQAARSVVGTAARRRARLAQVLAVILGVCALALAVLLWRLSQLVTAR
jgi:hypothetical protein